MSEQDTTPSPDDPTSAEAKHLGCRQPTCPTVKPGGTCDQCGATHVQLSAIMELSTGQCSPLREVTGREVSMRDFEAQPEQNERLLAIQRVESSMNDYTQALRQYWTTGDVRGLMTWIYSQDRTLLGDREIAGYLMFQFLRRELGASLLRVFMGVAAVTVSPIGIARTWWRYRNEPVELAELRDEMRAVGAGGRRIVR